MSYRPAVLAASILPLLIAMSATAEASAVCERLNARLANLPRIVASNANARDYTSAISRQNIDLRQVRNERRRLGCSSGSIIVVGGPNAQACDDLGASIDRMENELATLKARRQHLVSGGDSDVNRRRILAALEVNRCAEEQDTLINASASEPEIHRNILKDIPKAGETFMMLRGSAELDGLELPGIETGGSLRTMCVRTCDGAFFPISSHATPADFPRDASACERRCPGSQTELYYHALATQETDQMVSASSGEPYTSLPTAFAYRTRDLDRPGQCGCKASAVSGFGLDTKATTDQSVPDDGSSIVITTPPQKAAENKAFVEERAYDPKDSKIRVVGPTFLPPQESAIDLKHPTGPGYQPVQSN